MNVSWVFYVPFVLAMGLVLFMLYVAFFTEADDGKKKKFARPS